MTAAQKVIKYTAMAFAIFLCVSIISGIVGAVGAIFGIFYRGEGTTEDISSYSIEQDIASIEVSISAADMKIVEGEDFALESNLKKLTVKESNGKLTVKEESSFGVKYDNAVLTLTVPKDASFDSVSIETGAAKLSAASLCTKKLDIELGAGKIEIDTLNVTESADIEGGAGKLKISDGNICNLDLEMGAGSLELVSEITGTSRLEFGVGNVTLTLCGNRESYNIEFESGLGVTTVDGKKVTDWGGFGSGEHRLNIKGGIGKCDITFKD